MKQLRDEFFLEVQCMETCVSNILSLPHYSLKWPVCALNPTVFILTEILNAHE